MPHMNEVVQAWKLRAVLRSLSAPGKREPVRRTGCKGACTFQENVACMPCVPGADVIHRERDKQCTRERRHLALCCKEERFPSATRDVGHAGFLL